MDIYTKNHLIKWFILILVILNLVLLATLWYPRFFPPKQQGVETIQPDVPLREDQKRAKHTKLMADFLKRKLNFTPDQVDKFSKLQADHFYNTRRINREINELRKEMMDHLLEEKPDRTEVEKLAAKIGQRMSAHEKVVFNHFLELIELCNEDQKKKFRSMLGEILPQLAPPKEKPIKDRPIPPSPGDMREEPQPLEQTIERPRRGPANLERQIQDLQHRLKLSESQTKRIGQILESSMEKLSEIRISSKYRNHNERRSARDQILRWQEEQIQLLLNNEQFILFQEIKRKWRKDHQNPPPPY